MPFHPDPFDFDYRREREEARAHARSVLSGGRERWRFSDVAWLLLLAVGAVGPWLVFGYFVVKTWIR